MSLFKNLVTNGDFQGSTVTYQVSEDAAGTVNALVNAPFTSGWVVNADYAEASTILGDGITTILTDKVSSMPGRIGSSIPAYTGGQSAAYIGITVGDVVQFAIASSLNLSQTIVDGPLACEGKRVDFSFWYMAKARGRMRFQVIEIRDGVSTIMVDEKVGSSAPGQWKQFRRQYTSPLLAVGTLVTSTVIKLSFIDHSGNPAVAYDPYGLQGVAFTGFSLSVPLSTGRTFDNTARLNTDLAASDPFANSQMEIVDGLLCIWDSGVSGYRPLTCVNGALGTGDVVS